MLNHIVIMGRLARDPELRRTQTGTPVASFRLAVERDFKDKASGERITDWIDVTAWSYTAEFVSRYFTKGRMPWCRGGSRCGTGPTRTATSAPAPRSWRTACTGVTPGGRATARAQQLRLRPISPSKILLSCRMTAPEICRFKGVTE